MGVILTGNLAVRRQSRKLVGGFGYGGSSQIDGGGGGGGWYGGGASSGGGLGDQGNDVGGGGGSSYLSGFPGCEVSWTGYVSAIPR